MSLGYDRKLYILAFDHRGSFQKKMFGIEGDPTPEEVERIADAKRLIFEGMELAVQRGVEAQHTGVLVDEQFGSDIPERAREENLVLSMPVEKSGQDEFDFQYGDDFGEHIKEHGIDFAKVLVRFNPDGDQEMNQRQLERLKRLADWLHENDGKFLYELLVPAEPAQLESVGGDTDRYDAELRPELMRRAIEENQNYGVEVDVWKIEGVDAQEDAAMLAEQTRSGEGRENVVCVLLGRGASDDKVDHWLRMAAPVEGFVGFAIGRSIWWDALKGYLDGDLDRTTAAERIADNYLRFVQVYDDAERQRTRLKPPAGAAACLMAAALGACGTADPPPALTGRVVRVVDGDTIRVRLDAGGVERVRYIGIDTPEAGACFEPRAHALNSRLVAGRAVRLVRDIEERDRYGRLLAYVYAGPTFVNAELVRRGYAEPLVVPPNVRYAGRFAALAAGARRSQRGLWGACARAQLHGTVQAS